MRRASPGYRDRRHAGRVLAERVRAYVPFGNVLVLGLARGGVPVGDEIARAINAPLDVFVVRKLGVPSCPELAFGAIARGGEPRLDRRTIAILDISDAEVAAIVERERDELARRETAYRQGRPEPDCRGRCVVVVDDGLATGATMAAAIEAVWALGAQSVVAAAPVGPRETVDQLAEIADCVVCPLMPRNLEGVGSWYDDFTQVDDEAIVAMLAAPR